MKKQILLIDDNLPHNANFINALKEKYRVETMSYLRTAIYKLKKPEKYSIIILDLMMSPEIYKTHEVEDGLRTGYKFYKDKLQELGIPVILWTWDRTVAEELKDEWSNSFMLVVKSEEANHLVNAVDKLVEDKRINNV